MIADNSKLSLIAALVNEITMKYRWKAFAGCILGKF